MMWMEAGDCYIPDIKELKECSSKADPPKELPPSSSKDSSKDDANARGPRGKSVTNYIKIVPFTIESANERDSVLLSIRSNLANQVCYCYILTKPIYVSRARTSAIPCCFQSASTSRTRQC